MVNNGEEEEKKEAREKIRRRKNTFSNPDTYAHKHKSAYSKRWRHEKSSMFESKVLIHKKNHPSIKQSITLSQCSSQGYADEKQAAKRLSVG